MFPQKNIRIRSRVQVIAILLVSLFWGVSCQKTTEIVQDTERNSSAIRRILVLPFQDVSSIYGENVSIRCQLCSSVFTTGKVEPTATQFLTKQLNEMLDRANNFDLIPASQAQGVISSLLRQSEKELPEIDLYMKTGQALNADGVLAGYVYQFKDRDGSDYSVNQPASVTFHLDMIQVKGGQVVWSGHFNETQRSLSEDLFQLGNFIRRKGRWISAEDLAVYGLEQILKTLPPS
jgi:PBP1b-binding outer membrane lipoprotein LpoB